MRTIFDHLSGVLVLLLAVLLTETLPAKVDYGKLRKGQDAYQNEQWDEALNYFQDALLDDPGNPLLQFNIGTCLYQKQKYEEALKSFEKALITDDVQVQENGYYNQGNTYYRLNKYQEAIEAYKKALDLNPGDQDAKYNLELVRAKLKELADKQPQKDQPKQNQQQIEPSEFAKKLKARAEALVALQRYRDAYDLMEQGRRSDPTVAAYQDFIARIKDVVEIEESS